MVRLRREAQLEIHLPNLVGLGALNMADITV